MINPSFIILSYETLYTQTALFSNLKFPELPLNPKIRYVIYKIKRLVYDSAFKKDMYVKRIKKLFPEISPPMFFWQEHLYKHWETVKGCKSHTPSKIK